MIRIKTLNSKLELASGLMIEIDGWGAKLVVDSGAAD
jgi:hypothetical protein